MTAFRRLPLDGPDGRTAYFQALPGGVLEHLADSLDLRLIGLGREDAARGMELAADARSSGAELRTALKMLAGSLAAVANVAEARLEKEELDAGSD